MCNIACKISGGRVFNSVNQQYFATVRALYLVLCGFLLALAICPLFLLGMERILYFVALFFVFIIRNEWKGRLSLWVYIIYLLGEILVYTFRDTTLEVGGNRLLALYAFMACPLFAGGILQILYRAKRITSLVGYFSYQDLREINKKTIKQALLEQKNLGTCSDTELYKAIACLSDSERSFVIKHIQWLLFVMHPKSMRIVTCFALAVILLVSLVFWGDSVGTFFIASVLGVYAALSLSFVVTDIF